MAGILASMLGGAMVGGGQAWQSVSRDEEQNRQRMALEERRAKIEMDRQMAMEAIRQKHNLEGRAVDHKNRAAEIADADTRATRRDDTQYGRQVDRDALNNQRVDANTAAQREFIAGESKLDRENRIRAASIGRGESAGSLMTTGDGTVVRVTGTTATPVLGTDGKPLKGQSDMSRADQARVQSLQSELNSLGVDLRNPMLSDEEKSAINRQIKDVRGRIDAVFGGTAPGSSAGFGPEGPTEANIANLRKLKDRPGAVEQFDARFGQGAAARALADQIKAGESADLTRPNGVLSSKKPDPRPDFASDPQLSPADRVQQQEFDARRGRIESSKARAAEVQSFTPDRIKSLSPDEAQEILSRFGTELSGRQRAALNARLR